MPESLVHQRPPPQVTPFGHMVCPPSLHVNHLHNGKTEEDYKQCPLQVLVGHVAEILCFVLLSSRQNACDVPMRYPAPENYSRSGVSCYGTEQVHESCPESCLKVVQDILEAGSASEGHNNGAIIPGNEHLITCQRQRIKYSDMCFTLRSFNTVLNADYNLVRQACQ